MYDGALPEAVRMACNVCNRMGPDRSISQVQRMASLVPQKQPQREKNEKQCIEFD